MLRKIALALLMAVSIVTVIPFADSAAHGLRQSISSYRRRHHRHHSRRWWRRHRALVRQRQAARAAALAAHRNAPLMPAIAASSVNPVTTPPIPAAAINDANVPTRLTANVPGRTTLAVVALSRPAPAYLTAREQKQMMGGVSFGELRRIVIDKMFNAGGWVTNDFESEISGRRVLVVTAQTPAEGRAPEKSWNFYFTEVNGRIYSLTTEAPTQSADRMAGEAQRLIASIH